MKLLFKIFLPILVTLVVVFLATNYFSVSVFSNIFLENKALFLGDHALREVKESFTDEDLEEDPPSEKTLAKIRKFTKAIEDPSVFRFKVWNKRYEIVYSDLKQLIGRQQGDEYVKLGFEKNLPAQWRIEDPEPGSQDSAFGPFIKVIVPLKDSRGDTKYVLEVHSATSAVLRVVQSSINKTLYFLLGAGIVIFISFYLTVNSFVIVPIARLRKAMNIVGGGELSYEVKTKSNDEIGEIYRNFDKMRVQLKEMVEKMEGKVEERTKALTVAKDEVSRGWMQLQKEKVRLTASINSLSLGFIMTDIENKVVVSNSALEKIFNFQANSWDMDSVQNELKESFDFMKVCKDCTKDKKVIEVKDISYGTKFLRIFMSPIITRDNQTIGTVILIEDVTEAKVLDRSKDEFFSIASHELRTPLTAIKGNASLMTQYFSDKIKDPDLKEMISDIKESSERLIALVNDFLDMSRLEQGKMVFKKDKLDLPSVLESIIYEIAPLAKEKSIYLKMAPLTLKTLPQVVADSDKVKQIAYNLVGNAVKFTEKGGVTVGVEKEDGFLRVKISDTGRGIPEQNQSLLFRKFQQAGSSLFTRDTTKGTGLGLYISKMMVENMGGKIGLEKSKEGDGTTFAFSLPIAEEIPGSVTPGQNAAEATLKDAEKGEEKEEAVKATSEKGDEKQNGGKSEQK